MKTKDENQDKMNRKKIRIERWNKRRGQEKMELTKYDNKTYDEQKMMREKKMKLTNKRG